MILIIDLHSTYEVVLRPARSVILRKSPKNLAISIQNREINGNQLADWPQK